MRSLALKPSAKLALLCYTTCGKGVVFAVIPNYNQLPRFLKGPTTKTRYHKGARDNAYRKVFRTFANIKTTLNESSRNILASTSSNG